MTGTLIQEYLRHLHAIQSPETTIRSVTSVLTIAACYIPCAMEYATPRHLEQWQQRRATELSPRSLRTQIGTLRGFFKWAATTGRIKGDPSVALRPPRVGLTLPRPIPEQRLELAYQAADDRIRAILCLGAFAGLRCKEIAEMTWADVFLDAAQPHLYVHGKGRRERAVDISPDLADVLRALPHRRGPVIRRADGKPGHNSANNISKVMSRFFGGLGIEDTMHATRHRLLTEVCRIGGARQAQEVAGHASLATVSVYAKVLREDLAPTVHAAGRLNTRPRVVPEAS